MDNTAPYEIIVGPLELYVAPVGTSMPDVDEVPGAPWTKVGTNGPRNYSEEGVTVEHTSSDASFKPCGSTVPTKSWRTDEGMKIRVSLADLSLEQYALAMNGNTVTDTPAGVGTAGTKKLSLYRGATKKQYALIARGPSPYMDGAVAQYQVPVCSPSGNPSITYKKDAAILQIEFEVMGDPSNYEGEGFFAELVAMDAEASS